MNAKNISSTLGSGTRELLSSRLGFILIAAGCAIGLGNVWRFPYIAGQNGGAIFVGIYLLCLFLMGIPLLTMELSIGRASGHSIAQAFNILEPKNSKWHWMKYPMMCGNYILMAFYTVLTGWMLYYVYQIASGGFDGLNALPKNEIRTAVASKFSSLLADPTTMLSMTCIVVTVGILVCAKGVQKGVEAVTKPLMIILLLLLVGLAIYAMTLDGAMEGLKYYLYPDLERTAKVGWFKVIYEALNQAFFSLSIGQGSMLIFGSYVNKKRSLAQESIIIALLDSCVAFIAGLIIFPVCFSFGIQPDAGPNLLFNSMLNVFSAMEYGRVIGTIFFIFLFAASLTTVIAVFENIIATSIEQFKCRRRTSVFINFVLLSILAVPCVLGFNVWSDFQPFGAGSNVLDLEDFILSNNILPFGAFAMLLFLILGWKYHNFTNEVNQGIGLKLSMRFKNYYLYVLPIFVGCIIVVGYLEKFGVIKL